MEHATISIEEAQARLPELIAALNPGEELFIRRHDETVARLVGGAGGIQPIQRVSGSAIGQLRIIAEDDEHLTDFKEYME